MKVLIQSSGQYWVRQLGECIPLYKIGHYIREGHTITVRDELDIDQTKETLIRIAFYGKITRLQHGDFDIVDVLAEILDEEILYEIIESGGADNYILRKRRSEQ